MRSPRVPLAAAIGILAWVLTSAPGQAAPIDPGSPTTDWTAVTYPTLIPDFSDDQQTGIGESDIVGNTTDPAIYTSFDDAGTPSLTDGRMGFRVRIGSDDPPGNPNGAFSHFFAIGLDADLDGALDLFLGVNNSGQSDEIGIYDPGTGLNVSPNTTSIVSTPIVSYTELTSNYDYSAVDATIDPTASTFDVDGDGSNDFFLTFVIDFQDLVDELLANGITFDENSQFQMIAGTSTQANALNQDLGGPDGETNSSLTWSQLGAISETFSARDLLPMPEPNTGSLLGLGLVVLAAARRRRLRSISAV
jgi:hypothetical protein